MTLLKWKYFAQIVKTYCILLLIGQFKNVVYTGNIKIIKNLKLTNKWKFFARSTISLELLVRLKPGNISY